MDIGSRNRSRFKKTYGYERRRPVEVTVDDVVVDLQRFTVHRDLYAVYSLGGPGSGPGPTPEYAEYEENLVVVANATSRTFSFVNPFTQTPIIVVEILKSSSAHNLVLTITDISTTSCTVEFSASFNGQIRYMAVCAPSYPAEVDRNVLNPGQIATVSAGTISLANQSSFFAGFDPLDSGPSSFQFSTFDSANNNQTMVSIFDTAATTSAVEGQLSAPISGTINYMVIE